MKIFICLSVALLCCVSATPVKEDTPLEKEFKNIEQELEKITKDEAKSELEAELLKWDVSKDATKNDVAMKEEVAHELGEKDAGEKTPASFEALHDIMKKFDTGSMSKGKLMVSLEDYFSKDMMPFSDASSADPVCKDSRADCANMRQYCKSPAYEKSMKISCKKTCGFCVACENAQGDSKCKQLGKLGYCTYKRYGATLKSICYKECGYCRTSIDVPECSKTTFGCCWNKKDVKNNAEGSNCPPCVDKYRTACKTFKPDCLVNKIAGVFMRNHCSLSCGLCHKCFDEPDYAAKCSSWKRIGWCNTMKSTMATLCKSTCNMC